MYFSYVVQNLQYNVGVLLSCKALHPRSVLNWTHVYWCGVVFYIEEVKHKEITYISLKDRTFFSLWWFLFNNLITWSLGASSLSLSWIWNFKHAYYLCYEFIRCIIFKI